MKSGHKYKTNNKLVDLNPNVSVITSNINDLNTPSQRQRLSR